MCGIAGVFHFAESDRSAEVSQRVAAMLDCIRHRGPDDRGEMATPAFGMGTTRLSIIDLAHGHQPITAEDGRYAICFNGEIYNYRRLRADLIAEGAAFETESDTEVVLRGFLKWGPKVLDRLEGMFAFAVYDRRRHELFLARDRLGKKPLYYCRDDDKLVFCSEVQALARAGGLRLSIDAQSYWDYLTYRYVPGRATAYTEIRKLPRGHFCRVGRAGVETEAYWRIPRRAEAAGEATVPADPTQRFGELFATAVEKRLVADVPVGVVLSGGIDSSAVLMEASKHGRVDSYHVFFRSDDEDFNELKHAERMARHANSTLHVVEATEQAFFDRVADLAAVTDEPLADLASAPFKMVCDLAAKDLKVVLSGEGADEVLAGYGYHHLARRLARLAVLNRLPRPVLAALRAALEAACGRKLRIFDEVGVPAADYGRRLNHNITFQADHQAKLGLRADSRGFEDSARILARAYDAVRSEDPLNQMLHVVSGDWLTEDVLMKSDKVSMSASLEARCPFLDHALVEFLFGLPGESKVGRFGGRPESKVLLRRYLQGKVPADILSRRKLGFPVPAYSIRSDREIGFLEDVLGGGDCFYPRVLDRKAVLRLLADAGAERSATQTPTKHFLWSVAVFEIWFRRNGKYATA